MLVPLCSYGTVHFAITFARWQVWSMCVCAVKPNAGPLVNSTEKAN